MADLIEEDAMAAIQAKLAAAPKANGADNAQHAPLALIDPGIWQGKQVPERKWIVRDWIPSGYATALYGPGGIGKSLLALQLMTALARGKPWLGVPVAPIRSLGIFCEDDEDELHRRQGAINYALHGCQFSDLGGMRLMSRLGENNLLMTPSRKTGQMGSTGFFGQVCETAREFGAKLVVIDTVADTFGGNQNDAGQVRQYVQFGLARLARAIGGAVLACAHPSRAGINAGSGESGSVQWDAAFRSRLYLSPPTRGEDDRSVDPDARVLTRKKANYAAREETIDLRWHDGVFGTGAVGGDGSEKPSVENVFLALLDKMTAEGQALSHNARAGNYAPRLMRNRPERAGYQVNDFERAMQALFAMGDIRIEEYGKPSDRREEIIRSVRVESPF